MVLAGEPPAEKPIEPVKQETRSETLEQPKLTEAEIAIKAIAIDTDNWDYIRLTSGEWLKGELHSLYHREIEFESDKLDTLLLDDDDVDIIISLRRHSIRFYDGTLMYGSVKLYDSKVYIDDELTQYSFGEVFSIAGGQRGADLWNVKLGIGLNISKGNVEEIDWSAKADVIRRTTSSRLVGNMLAYRTKNEGEITRDSQRFSVNYDWFKNSKLFFRPAVFEYYRDPFLNISHRYNYGAGIGYYFIDDGITDFDVNLGPGYQWTEFEAVEAGQEKSEEAFSSYLEINYSREMTSDFDFSANYSLQSAPEESGGNSHHTVLTFNFDITNNIDFDVSVVWDRQDKPQPGPTGITPQKDDYLMIVSLSVDL